METPKFLPCPEDIKALIVAAECKRLAMDAAECCSGGIFGYVPSMTSDCPGFSGEVVVIIWGGVGPEAVTTYARQHGSADWEFCNQTNW